MHSKLLLLLLTCLLVFSGCSSTANNTESTASNTESEIDTIDFEYFFRGFSHASDKHKEYDFYDILGDRLITNEEDWYTFTNNFCSFAGKFSTPDFNEYYLLVNASLYGSSAGANSSHEIDTIQIVDNEIFATSKPHTAMDIYAMNSDGFGHLFVNVVVVSREDIPDDIKNVFPPR